MAMEEVNLNNIHHNRTIHNMAQVLVKAAAAAVTLVVVAAAAAMAVITTVLRTRPHTKLEVMEAAAAVTRTVLEAMEVLPVVVATIQAATAVVAPHTINNQEVDLKIEDIRLVVAEAAMVSSFEILCCLFVCLCNQELV